MTAAHSISEIPNARAWTTLEHRKRGGQTYPPGPWDNEPDKVSWTDPTTGRPCLIVRGPMGALCGYVAVDPGHPYYGATYEDFDVEVHGGLTYADPCMETDDESVGICHVPELGDPDDVWWFGFDCSHAGDIVPAMESFRIEHGFDPKPYPEAYRTITYVADQCRSLAQQLVQAGEKS